MAITGPTNFRANKTTAKPGEEITFTWTAAAGDFDGYIYDFGAPNNTGVGIIRSNTQTSLTQKMPDESHIGYKPDDYFEMSIFAVKGIRTTEDYDEKGPTSSVKVYYDVSGSGTPEPSVTTGKLEQFQNSAGEQIYPRTIIEGIFRQSDGKSLTELLTESGGDMDLSLYAPKLNPVFSGGVVLSAGTASGEGSLVSGSTNIVSARNSMAFGDNHTVSGFHSLAFGHSCTVDSANSIAAGNGSTVENAYMAFAFGQHAYVHADGQFAIGEYNVISSSTYDRFSIGKGNSSARANCFRATNTGVYASGSYNASGADYAEMFEWADGNPDNEDQAGRFVTLDGAKIRLAEPEDDYILGIVSGNPSVVGDVHDDQWQGMYLYDIFGRPIWEDVEVPEQKDNTGRIIFPARVERRQKLNPDYDNTQKYTPRSQRPEWDAVGMLGKLVAVDDGSCVVNGWCTVGEGGAATASESRTRYRVMERLDENHIRVMIL